MRDGIAHCQILRATDLDLRTNVEGFKSFRNVANRLQGYVEDYVSASHSTFHGICRTHI